MSKVHKYTIPTTRREKVWMREGSEVLSVGAQNRDVVVWVREHETNPYEARSLYGALTGEEVSEGDLFHGTAQLENGFFIHVFEEVAP